jgi:chromosome partitioning protein
MVRHVFDLFKTSNSLEQLPTTAVIVNQAKSRTVMFRHLLDDVLNRLAFPVIGTLRDTQNYPVAAMDGKGIVELPARRVIKDLLEWRPILEWLMQALYPDRMSEIDAMFGAIGTENKG